MEPDAFLNLGVAYLKNQQYELAKEQLKKTLDITMVNQLKQILLGCI